MKSVVVAAALAFAVSAAFGQVVFSGPGAHIKGLDTITGRRQEIEVAIGETATFGRMSITLRECRYDPENPAGHSYAFLTITEQGSEEPVFDAWMVSAAPALSAMDHYRYDIWLIRCKTLDAVDVGG